MDIVEDIDLLLDADLNEIINIGMREYNIRPRTGHFNYWDNQTFFNRFRLSKPTVSILLEEIIEEIRNPTERNLDRALTPMNKLLLTLRYLATVSFYITVGDFGGIHKSSAGRIINEVITAICRLRERYIKFPETEAEKQSVKIDFYGMARFPKVLGVIDCTHIKVQSPGGDRAEIFRNRKGYFSINCQAICDANYIIRDLVCRWPGSAHDTHIFENSNIKMCFHNNEMADGILLGDSGYPSKRYLMIPIANPEEEAANLYNESLVRTRCIVERTFGIWKRRFPILSLGIRTNLNLTQKTILACGILHNLACQQHEQIFDEDNNEQDLDMIVNDNVNLQQDRAADDVLQTFLVYFRNLL